MVVGSILALLLVFQNTNAVAGNAETQPLTAVFYVH